MSAVSEGGLYPYIRIGIRGTHAELNRHGEEVATGLLRDSVAAWNAWQIDVGWLDDALLALQGAEDLLGEAARSVSMCNIGR